MADYPQEGVIRVRWCYSGEIIDADRNGLGYGLLYFDELKAFIASSGVVVTEGEEGIQWTIEDIERIQSYRR